MATYVAGDEKACLDDVRYLLSFLPSNNMEEPPRVDSGDDPDRLCPELREILLNSEKFEARISDAITLIK